MYIYNLIFLILFLPINLFSNDRYVCNQEEIGKSPLITNFYIINDRLIMSGIVGSGEYKIVSKNKDGLLAVNSSFVGKDFGLETILLNKKQKKFFYKLLLENKNTKNVTKVNGTCEFFN